MPNYGENYIEVYNQGRDTNEPLLTIYDNDGLNLFFHLLTAAPTIARAAFKDGQIALVSFHVDQELMTGSGRYDLGLDGKLTVKSETGVLAGLLDRIEVTHD